MLNNLESGPVKKILVENNNKERYNTDPSKKMEFSLARFSGKMESILGEQFGDENKEKNDEVLINGDKVEDPAVAEMMILQMMDLNNEHNEESFQKLIDRFVTNDLDEEVRKDMYVMYMDLKMMPNVVMSYYLKDLDDFLRKKSDLMVTGIDVLKDKPWMIYDEEIVEKYLEGLNDLIEGKAFDNILEKELEKVLYGEDGKYLRLIMPSLNGYNEADLEVLDLFEKMVRQTIGEENPPIDKKIVDDFIEEFVNYVGKIKNCNNAYEQLSKYRKN